MDSKSTNALQRISRNTAHLVALKFIESDITSVSTNIAASIVASGIKLNDVVSIEMRIHTLSSPTDTKKVVTLTTVSGDTPTASHGMFLGEGDLYTVTGNENCRNLKMISTEVGKTHNAHFVVYGYSGE